MHQDLPRAQLIHRDLVPILEHGEHEVLEVNELREYIQRSTREQEEPDGAGARKAVQIATELGEVLPHGFGCQRLVGEKGHAGMQELVTEGNNRDHHLGEDRGGCG